MNAGLEWRRSRPADRVVGLWFARRGWKWGLSRQHGGTVLHLTAALWWGHLHLYAGSGR